MNEKVAALYLRISDEDGEESRDESNSISSQRELLAAFIKTHGELNRYTVKEFCDDGYSGTNFQRPQVRKLLGQIREGMISCVLVKDFSRFGRNYIEVGNYLEQVFPFLGVRFISVNDCFDSGVPGAGEYLDAAFKNLIYDLYSKDISEKVASVRRLKAGQGRFFTAYAPYGYRKASGQKLIVDKEAAAVVQRIFRLASRGIPKTQIARTLNEEGVPTPLMLRRERKQNFPCYPVNEKCVWRVSAISAILKDQRYTGDAVYGKVKPAAAGSAKSRPVPGEQWIVAPDNHEPIVSRELFHQVNAMFTTRRSYHRNEKGPLSGIVRCAACGHVITGKRRWRAGQGEFAAYRCQTLATTGEFGCYTKAIEGNEIEQAVLLLMQKACAVQMDKDMEEAVRKIYKTKENDLQKQLTACDTEIKRLGSLRSDKYKAYKNGTVTREEFIRLKKEYDAEEKELLQNCEEKRKELHRLRNKSAAKHVTVFDKLTREAAAACVNQIFINRDGSLRIEWNYQGWKL